jgi:YVTN family beta-propeller protein
MALMLTVCSAVLPLVIPDQTAAATTNSFVNFETAPVHPVVLSPDGDRLAVCNLADNRLEVFNVSSGAPVLIGGVPVGLDPVSVRFHTPNEAWVVNHVSDSVSVVNVDLMRVVATIDTGDGPADVAFAGNPVRAFVSCASTNAVQVFDPANRTLVQTLALDGQRPKAIAVSPDRAKVYVAIFESGNRSTILSTSVGTLDGFPQPSVVDLPTGPHRGQNPPPNNGTNFLPTINPAIPTNVAAPKVSVIAKKNAAGRWVDDNNGDWTEFVSGTNSVFSGRPRGWDILDHDVAVIDTASMGVSYLTGLMNICMDVAVNPASGQVTVVGTDALNHIRFESVLRGVFIRVNLALANPANDSNVVKDLNAHLDYKSAVVPEAERNKSIGDPRGIVWNADGTRGYVTGMGSDNLIVIDPQGNRVGRQPALELGEGPTGMALDDARSRLYVWNRFSATVSVVDTVNETVVTNVPLFDPTPIEIKAGRKHLYNTRKTSGLGQASCASCHVDARFDRLAWDLGDPPAEVKTVSLAKVNFGRFPPSPTNHFHPMKGPMMTQTLQDIIGHEPFHWRGDRDGIEQFNGTFTNLQAAASVLTTNQMQEFESFLATVHFPPNPFRLFNNSLSTNLPLMGHVALGRGIRPAGQQLPNGNPQRGLTRFRLQGTVGCIHCHTLPTGLGTGMRWNGFSWAAIPQGTNGESHAALIQLNRSAQLPFKISQLRNLQEKIGLDFGRLRSEAGFGFMHDGSVDSLVRFLQDSFDFRDDQETADMVAFLLSLTGSDLPSGVINDPDRAPGLPGRDVAAAVGRQITIDNPAPVKLIADMIGVATSSTGRVDLVVRGEKDGLKRGWLFDRGTRVFQSDRNGETILPDTLRMLASATNELTYTVMPRNNGRRMGIDRDEDGFLDLTEIEFGSDPTNPLSLATNRSPVIGAIGTKTVAAGSVLSFAVSANDPDIPQQTLTFTLEPPVPEGVAIDSMNGLFSWGPSQAFALDSYSITVRVTDNGSPNRSSTATFLVNVLQHPLAPRVEGVIPAPGGVTISWGAVEGRTYRVQFKDSLNDSVWVDMEGSVIAGGPTASKVDSSLGARQERYYRILLME